MYSQRFHFETTNGDFVNMSESLKKEIIIENTDISYFSTFSMSHRLLII